MKDTTQNYVAFLTELGKLSEVFCDPMSEVRQDLYWKHIGLLVTLEEWHDVCHKAITQTTFHKVPLIPILLGYLQECRTQCAIEETEKQWSLTCARRLRLEADPVWQATYAAAQAEAITMAAQQAQDRQAWYDSLTMDDHILFGHINPPRVHSHYDYRRRTHEELEYAPVNNPQQRRSLLRQQLMQIMQQEGRDGTR